jgi:CheY-like chemotaxis protein
LKRSDGSNICILIVDDDKDDHFFIKRALKRIVPDATIKSVYDGSEAIDYLWKKGKFESSSHTIPQVIFMDINMPKINGKAAVATIKKDKKFCEIPIVVLTTSSNPADRDHMMDLY